MNRVGTRGSRFAVNRAKKDLQEQITWELVAAGVPRGLSHVSVRAELRFPRRAARRDPGNFGWLLDKALGDALAPHDQDAPHRWLPDDTSEFYEYGPTVIESEPGPARSRLVLTVAKS